MCVCACECVYARMIERWPAAQRDTEKVKAMMWKELVRGMITCIDRKWEWWPLKDEERTRERER